MKWWAGLAAALLACGGCKDDKRGATATAAVATSSAAHDAVPHGHAPAHGGQVAATPAGHLELVADPSGAFELYLLDLKLAPRSGSGATASVRTTIPGYPEVRLVQKDGEGLRGHGPEIGTRRFTAAAVVRDGERVEIARFGPFGTSTSAAAPRSPAVPFRPLGGDRFAGHLMDATCLAAGEKPAPEHAECARKCIQNGSPIAIVAEDGKRAVLAVGGKGRDDLSLADLLLPYLGRRIQVHGKLTKIGGTEIFEVEGIVAEHDHTPHHGGVIAMAGDMHLELVVERSGAVRVHVSDAYRNPVATQRMKGTVEVRRAYTEETPASAPLVPDAEGKALAGRVAALPEKEYEVTARVPLPGDPKYSIAFILEPAAPAP